MWVQRQGARGKEEAEGRAQSLRAPKNTYRVLRRRRRRIGLSLRKSSSKARKSWRPLGVPLRAFCVHAERVRSTGGQACGAGWLRAECGRAARSTTLPPPLQQDHSVDEKRQSAIGAEMQSEGLCRRCWFVKGVGGGTTVDLKAQTKSFRHSEIENVATTYFNKGF